jgi:hypothetical protein
MKSDSNDSSIKLILYKMVHRNKKPLMAIADETGISANYLVRTALPIDESGARFPLDNLITLVKATKDYSILKHLANLCGFLIVKIPNYNAYKSDGIDLINTYQGYTCDAVKALRNFLNFPDKESYQKVTDSLTRVMEQNVTTQKYIQCLLRSNGIRTMKCEISNTDIIAFNDSEQFKIK